MTIRVKVEYSSWAAWRDEKSAEYHHIFDDGYVKPTPGTQVLKWKVPKGKGKRGQGKSWQYAYILMGAPENYFYEREKEGRKAWAQSLLDEPRERPLTPDIRASLEKIAKEG